MSQFITFAAEEKEEKVERTQKYTEKQRYIHADINTYFSSIFHPSFLFPSHQLDVTPARLRFHYLFTPFHSSPVETLPPISSQHHTLPFITIIPPISLPFYTCLSLHLACLYFVAHICSPSISVSHTCTSHPHTRQVSSTLLVPRPDKRVFLGEACLSFLICSL